MLKKIKPWHIIVALLVITVIILIYVNRTWVADKLGINKGRMANGQRRSATAGLSSTYKSNGCSCINGYISNYGNTSSLPCNRWSIYCEGTVK